MVGEPVPTIERLSKPGSSTVSGVRKVATKQQAPASTLAPDQWWRTWVRDHPVASILLVGLVATHVATLIGSYLPGIGLPELQSGHFNAAYLSSVADSSGSFLDGYLVQTFDGIAFAVLFAVVIRSRLTFVKNGILKGVVFGLALGILSIGFLLPYVYAPKSGLGLFSFDTDDGWKLPAAVLVWHAIYGFLLGLLYKSDEAK